MDDWIRSYKTLDALDFDISIVDRRPWANGALPQEDITEAACTSSP